MVLADKGNEWFQEDEVCKEWLREVKASATKICLLKDTLERKFVKNEQLGFEYLKPRT